MKIKNMQANMGKTISQKIIEEHLVSGDYIPGDEIGIRIDQTLIPDATGTVACLQFESMKIPKAKKELSVIYVDHNTAQIGLWHNNNKIASMGISVSRWITSYGFALNLGGDYELSKYIRPCGLDVKLTTVAEITGNEPDKNFTIDSVVKNFQQVFHRKAKESVLKLNKFELAMN